MRTRHALAGLGALTLCLSLGAPAVAGQDGAGQDGTGRDQVKEQAKDQRQVRHGAGEVAIERPTARSSPRATCGPSCCRGGPTRSPSSGTRPTAPR